MDVNPVGFQRWGFGGPTPQEEVLKVKVLHIGSKPHTIQGKDESCWVPFQYMWLCQGRDYWQDLCLYLSHLFRCGIFLVCTMCRSHLVSLWISLTANCSVWSCRFAVSVWESKFKSLLCCHLEVEPLFCPSFKNWKSAHSHEQKYICGNCEIQHHMDRAKEEFCPLVQ